MNDADSDEMGIRINPPNLVYTTNDVSRWIGSGILNKPIGDFFLQFHAHHTRALSTEVPHPYFAGISGVTYKIHRRVIPEPAEYALVFGLFALGFVIFMKYKVQQDGKRKQPQ